MKNNFIITAVLTALFLTSCTKDKAKEKVIITEDVTLSDTAKTATETTASSNTDEIVKSSAKDKSGKTLEMSFNNTKNTASIIFEGETINLEDQKPASGIWYKNDHYELRGKGDQVELSKDGKTVFSN